MKNFALAFLAIILLIEEWLWDVLSALSHKLILWLHLARLEQWLSQAPRGVALTAMLIPMLIVTPLNLAALWLLATGKLLLGIGLEIIAKLLGTLLVARVFALTKNQLLTFAAIAWVYHTVTGWLAWAHAKITATGVYRLVKRAKEQARAYWLALRSRLRRLLIG